ncbi:sigma-70 family RNA polymerase sigma factor [Dawidia soli]|uniref:Sigma-70 family RNA polymerase sigma factor n=1 Tax=Dawidia soli TaxID=2782352 RepID=A0AAP2D8R1_9BACT|nr:sigma-70 family RNA polymerase sigma factor [Dawidia soli]MBT1686175.1 sigma-70 family RNA polymerase sigma factor [Dawidia soli]
MESTVGINLNFFQQELKGFVYKRVRDKSLTEDIVHDVFIKVQNKIGQLHERDKLTNWIYQITKNAIIDHFRKQSRSLHASDLDWENDAPNFNECVTRCLENLMASLPDKYREALQLADVEKMPQLELAKRLGISYSGAKSRVQRARQILKERMDETLIIKLDSYGNVIVCENRSKCC